jgi:hypothetical protein
VQPRDITGRRHHAALAAAHDHRNRRQLRPVAFFDAGIEGVAIDVGDRQIIQIRMKYHAAAAALAWQHHCAVAA